MKARSGADTRCDAASHGASIRFSGSPRRSPTYTLTVQVTEQDSKEALGGVEIRLGPFHGRTDKAGRAELRVCGGEYRLELWRNAYHRAAQSRSAIQGDSSVELTMLHVPEEHPDARWVR